MNHLIKIAAKGIGVLSLLLFLLMSNPSLSRSSHLSYNPEIKTDTLWPVYNKFILKTGFHWNTIDSFYRENVEPINSRHLTEANIIRSSISLMIKDSSFLISCEKQRLKFYLLEYHQVRLKIPGIIISFLETLKKEIPKDLFKQIALESYNEITDPLNNEMYLDVANIEPGFYEDLDYLHILATKE
jgi:hypothetical protein